MPRFLARPSLAGELPSRRDWLRIGVPALLAATARPGQARPLARAKSVLVVFTSGGQSQLDTWDPKPDAPAEVRGAFGTIPTALPGLRFCEHLPRLAKLADRFTRPAVDDPRRPRPRVGVLPGADRPVPPAQVVQPAAGPDRLPGPRGGAAPRPPDATGSPTRRSTSTGRSSPREESPGQYGGFLGRGYDPLELGDVSAGAAFLDGMSLPPDVSRDRLQSAKVTRGGARLATRSPSPATVT